MQQQLLSYLSAKKASGHFSDWWKISFCTSSWRSITAPIYQNPFNWNSWFKLNLFLSPVVVLYSYSELALGAAALRVKRRVCWPALKGLQVAWLFWSQSLYKASQHRIQCASGLGSPEWKLFWSQLASSLLCLGFGDLDCRKCKCPG